MPETPADSARGALDGWWGDYRLAVGEMARFKIGPLTLWLERAAAEWRLATLNSGDRHDGEVVVDCPDEPAQLPAAATIERLAVDASASALRLTPALADRLVVTRPEGRLRVLAGSRITFYVSTPLWLRLEGLEPRRLLVEAPVIRPSDTWFGPSTRHGEIGYASRTPSCREPGELPRLPFRAITRVGLRNRADDNLDLMRFALPAPNLSLYVDRARPHLGLWTSAGAVARRTDRDLADVEVQRRPPRDLAQPELVAAPRSARSRTIWSRAMSSILS